MESHFSERNLQHCISMGKLYRTHTKSHELGQYGS